MYDTGDYAISGLAELFSISHPTVYHTLGGQATGLTTRQKAASGARIAFCTTLRESRKSRAIALIGFPSACSRRIRKTVSTTNIPISPPGKPDSSQHHQNEGPLLDAEPQSQCPMTLLRSLE